MKPSRISLAILVVVFIGQAVYFYPQLPPTIASHFDASGHANGFMSKGSFFAFETVMIVILLAIFLSMTKLISKMPDSLINLPNKAYWLAPERREQTFAVFGDFFGWVSAMIVALYIAVNQIVLTANVLKKDPSSTQFWIVLGIFLVFVAVLTFRHLGRFLGKK